jgi:hypothetical protein
VKLRAPAASDFARESTSMKGWIRLGLVLSGFWIVGVFAVAFVEFLLRDPGVCRSANTYLDAVELFFRCNSFADLVPSFVDRFFLEFRLKFFLLIVSAPVLIGWIVAVVLFHSIRWIVRGFKG